MPSSLLESQLQTLEPPEAEEGAIVVEVSSTASKIADKVLSSL
jgi:gluconate kinase